MLTLLCGLWVIMLAADAAAERFRPKFMESLELGGKCQCKDFKVQRSLGKGGHGTVKQAIHVPSNKEVALKVFRVKKEKAEDLRREEEIQHRLDHPSISRHLCTMINEDEVIFVLELVQGQSLRSILKDNRLYRSQMIDVKQLVRGLVEVLEYLRSQQVVFGDLSSGNVMITKHGRIKLVDFGAALQVEGRQEAKPVFVNYKTRPHRWFNYAADWYSLGLLTLEILVATTQKAGEVHWRDQRVFYRQSCASLLGHKQQEACDLIDHLVTKDWQAIWGQSDASLSKLKSHPWLNSP
jgi:serine/threonine protein kinase